MTHTGQQTPSTARDLRSVRGQDKQVRALRIDIDGRLTQLVYRGREHHVLREPLEVRAQDAPGGVAIRSLDEDLVMWVDEYGAEHQPINPTASVVAAAFGHHEQVFGPVVFTGWHDTGGVLGGRTCDISAAATVLLAGMAASCDTPWVGADRGPDRAGEWTGLGVAITRGPGAESFDALAWTITRDGDVLRCVECGEPRSCPEHQPEILAEQHEIDPGGGMTRRKPRIPDGPTSSRRPRIRPRACVAWPGLRRWDHSYTLHVNGR